MLVCESMEACISICTCAKSSMHSSSRPIPSHRVLSLVNPLTDVPLQRSIPVRVPGRGGGSGLEARLGVTMGGVVTTTLVVTRVATPIPSVPLGLLRVSLRCSHGLRCNLHTSSPTSARWSCEAMVHLSHPIKL
jgi:hypothetical protein